MNTAAMKPSSVHTSLRLGSVSFLNAKPLIYGLEEEPRISLSLAVPSMLAEMLDRGAVDVALLPVIDYQRLRDLRLIRAGGIACNGPTLTVRIFSKVPLDQIDTLACDPDSHTSVALAAVLMAERWGRRPKHVALRDPNLSPDTARLLIGDKVITEEPQGFDYQLDLGEAWKDLTGLPFVFAAWMARPGAELGEWPARLERAKHQGLANIDAILARHAAPLGWPVDIARRYLTEYLRFNIGDREIAAIELFHQLAAKHGLIASPAQSLRY
ncbi:menaquinone biosynthesis protein [soil metagenome]